ALAGLLWQRTRLRLRGLAWREATGRALESGARLDTFHTVGTTFGTIDPVCGAAYQARALLLALDLGDRARIARAFALEAIPLASQGSIDRARALADETTKLAAEAGDPYLVALARAAEGIIAYYACDYLEANDVLL